MCVYEDIFLLVTTTVRSFLMYLSLSLTNKVFSAVINNWWTLFNDTDFLRCKYCGKCYMYIGRVHLNCIKKSAHCIYTSYKMVMFFFHQALQLSKLPAQFHANTLQLNFMFPNCIITSSDSSWSTTQVIVAVPVILNNRKEKFGNMSAFPNTRSWKETYSHSKTIIVIMKTGLRHVMTTHTIVVGGCEQ